MVLLLKYQYFVSTVNWCTFLSECVWICDIVPRILDKIHVTLFLHLQQIDFVSEGSSGTQLEGLSKLCLSYISCFCILHTSLFSVYVCSCVLFSFFLIHMLLHFLYVFHNHVVSGVMNNVMIFSNFFSHVKFPFSSVFISCWSVPSIRILCNVCVHEVYS